MGDPRSEQSNVDARGIKPPSVYSIASREAGGGVVVLALEGEFDLAAAPTMREHLDRAAGGGARGVVLDLAEVTFLDSSALRELLRADGALRARGARLVLAAVPPGVARLLEITRTTGMLTAAPTLEDALERAAA
jgi:anti-sigma B factor antagonist